MKNNKGFAITSIIYAMLILFLGLIFLILGNLASRKAMFDKEKNEILSRFNGDDDALKKYKNGDVVYFDVDNGTECSNYTETQSNTGVNRGCMKFYAFNDDGGKTVKLILDHNTTATVEWNSNYETTGGPKELLIQLERDTKLWQGTETPANYTMDQTGQLSNRKYTIYYSGYKARLITAQEIAQITGYTSWNEKKSDSDEYEYGFYFDSKQTSASDTCNSNDISGCSYRWLYDRTSTDCTRWGCLNAAVLSVTDSGKDMVGYWTASSSAADSSKAWNVLLYGNLNSEVVNEDRYFGVRPVIEVLKSKLVKKYTNGEVVYFDVDNGTKCSNYTETQSNTGTKSGCMKFYAFNDDGKDTVNLILDHNTTAKATWITKEDYIAAGGEDLSSDKGACQLGKICSKNKYGPLTLLTQLKNDTKSWVGTKTPSNYTMDQTGQRSNAKYTIDYSSYKARLITAQEIAKITGNTHWNEKTAASYDYYFFDSKTDTASTTCKNGNTTGCSYGWLYDRTNTSCIDSGCLNNSDQTTDGYWTSSSFAMDAAGAWYVQFDSIIRSGSIIGNDNKSIGVRPVIEVLKSNLI